MFWSFLFVPFVLYLLYIFKLQHRRIPNVPGPTPHWLWGNFYQPKDTVVIHDFTSNLSKAYGERTVQAFLQLDPNPYLLLGPSEENAKWLLKSNFDNYIKAPILTNTFVELLGKGIFATDGDAWREQRKVASYMFSQASLRDFMVDVFVKNGHKVVKLLRETMEEKSEIDLQDLMSRFMVTTFMEVGFGTEVPDGVRQGCHFAKMFDVCQLQMAQRFSDPFWKIRRFFHIGEREKLIRNAISYLNQFCAETVADRRKNVRTDKNRDLLSRAIIHGEERGDPIKDETLRDMMINFLLAGRDTTTVLLSWTIYMLTLHPEIEAKVLDEIAQAPEDPYKGAASLHYTEAVLLETGRLYPPVPSDAKYALGPDVLPDGTPVPKHATIAYRPYIFGRSEALWGADFATFRPERWLEGSHSEYKYVTFNAGLRLCLGKSVALLEAKLLLRMILPLYKFTLCRPEEVKYARSLVLTMKNGLWATVQPRQ